MARRRPRGRIHAAKLKAPIKCLGLVPPLGTPARQSKCSQRPFSFGNRIGAGEQRRGHGETKRLGSLEIDGQFKL